MVELTNKEFFQDLDQTIAAQLFEQTTYPWEILPLIKDFVLEVGPTLSVDEYDQVEEDVWIAKSATIAKTATINGPAIIGPDTEVRPGAFIRGNALIGAGCVVGNSTEIKNDILFNNVQVPHYNYVGDSILGYKSHMGAGSITSNVKSDKTNVVIKNSLHSPIKTDPTIVLCLPFYDRFFVWIDHPDQEYQKQLPYLPRVNMVSHSTPYPSHQNASNDR